MAGPDFSAVSKVIKSVAGLIAVVPGLALITNAITLPLTLQQLLGALALALGVVIVIAIYLFGQRLHQMKAQRVGLIVVGLAVAGVTVAMICSGAANTYVLKRMVDGAVELRVLPLNPSGQLKTDLEDFGGDYDEALRHPVIGARVSSAIDRQDGGTVLLLSVSFLLAQALLLGAIVIGAWKLADTLRQRRRSTDGPGEPPVPRRRSTDSPAES